MALHASPPLCTAGRRLPSSPPRAGCRRSLPAAARPRRVASAAAALPLRTRAVRTKVALSSDGAPEMSDSPHVVCFGELLIDFVPTANGVSLAEASAFKKAPGGAPANVAVGIARLGGSSAFIGKLWLLLDSEVMANVNLCSIVIQVLICYLKKKNSTLIL